MKSNILFGLILLFRFVSFGQTDFEILKDYIPFAHTSLETHPIITIKVHVHVIQRYKDNPQNITENDQGYIEKQFDWINEISLNFTRSTENGKFTKPVTVLNILKDYITI